MLCFSINPKSTKNLSNFMGYHFYFLYLTSHYELMILRIKDHLIVMISMTYFRYALKNFSVRFIFMFLYSIFSEIYELQN